MNSYSDKKDVLVEILQNNNIKSIYLLSLFKKKFFR